MPSILSNISSEPVTLVQGDDPKEPAVEPQEKAIGEKSSATSSGPVDATAASSLGNIVHGENNRGARGGKNVISSGPYLVNGSSPAGNGRLSTSSVNSGLQESGRGSMSAGGTNKPLEFQAISHDASSEGRAVTPNGNALEPTLVGHAEQASPTRAPPSVPMQTRRRRAQSASTASGPSVLPISDVTRSDSNRLSTPTNVGDSGPRSPVSPRLVHRHTLEVPKLATARSSKDYSFTRGRSSEDAISPIATSTGVRRSSMNLVRRATRSMQSDAIFDEVPQDADAARMQESMRAKRSSRRKRREEEDFDKVIVGKKVDENHVNWILAYDMLTGIRFTVSRTNAKIDRQLQDEDFLVTHKFSFDVTGNELTPSAKYDFKFKDYAPWVFRKLRTMFHLDPADYLVSLTAKVILSELGSPGKSGSFFYFSRDYKFIIKTIHHAEHKLLRKILKEYYAHVQENPNTLISQFYGLHRIKIPYGKKIHFVVMNNLFPPHRDIHQTFDLKGSTIGRDFKEEELEKNPRATLKDLNWLRRNYHLELGPIKKNMFIEQMSRDVALLKKLKIMDYSLLVGIHDLSKGNEENLRDKTLQVFQPEGDEPDQTQARAALNRTPSRVETQRKAKELRQALHREKPVPMDVTDLQMPETDSKMKMYFYSDDGGFRATHEDNEPGEDIYYLGIIDCLTHYGLVKRLEHFWKGMQNNKTQISPIPPEGYGDRFVHFISGVTMPREEAEKHNPSVDGATASSSLRQRSVPGISRTSSEKVVERAERQAHKTEEQGADESDAPDRRLTAARSPSAERTGGLAGTTLPVLEEVGESGSVAGRSIGGHSGRSRNSQHSKGRDGSGDNNNRNNQYSNPNVIDNTNNNNSNNSQAMPQTSANAPPLGGRPPPTPPGEPPTPPRSEAPDSTAGREKDRDKGGRPLLPNPRFSGSPITFMPDHMTS